jgi:hypothetical protein
MGLFIGEMSVETSSIVGNDGSRIVDEEAKVKVFETRVGEALGKKGEVLEVAMTGREVTAGRFGRLPLQTLVEGRSFFLWLGSLVTK